MRSASRAASSVGSASASSQRVGVQRLACRRSTAASACSVTRTTLLCGCCAVSVEPAVWAWKRSISERSVFGAEALLHDLGPQPAGGAELGHLLEEVVVDVEEEGEPRARTRRRRAPRSSAAST